MAEDGRVDPLVCPRGHHSISLSADRFSCQTCRNQGRETTVWAKSELVDLRERNPPEDERDRLMTDGGGEDVVYYATGQYDVYHERRDCRYLRRAESVRELLVSTMNGTREPCGGCVDTVDGSDPDGRLVADGGPVDYRRTRDPIWMVEGGEGLPLFDKTDKEGQIWLFTCCICGSRWANPPAPVAGCSCGSDQIVCHRFDSEVYRSIRAHGDPRGESA